MQYHFYPLCQNMVSFLPIVSKCSIIPIHCIKKCGIIATQLFEAVYAFVASGYLESSLAFENEPVEMLCVLASLHSVLAHLDPFFPYFGQDGTHAHDMAPIGDPLPLAVWLGNPCAASFVRPSRPVPPMLSSSRQRSEQPHVSSCLASQGVNVGFKDD